MISGGVMTLFDLEHRPRKRHGQAIQEVLGTVAEIPDSTALHVAFILGMHEETVRKILERLVARNIVQRDPDEYNSGGNYERGQYVRYRLTPAEPMDWAWRPCMQCSTKFWSWGKANRLCKKHSA